MTRTRNKIALIGAGQIGGIMALLAAQKNLGDVMLLDIPEAEGTAKGKALDISEMRAIACSEVSVRGTSDYADLQGADLRADPADAGAEPWCEANLRMPGVACGCPEWPASPPAGRPAPGLR